MYEGSDCCQEMNLVLLKYFVDVERLQSDEFFLYGHKVKVFIEGDIMFLGDCLDHQGSAVTYPSAKYTLHQDHQQSHLKDTLKAFDDFKRKQKSV